MLERNMLQAIVNKEVWFHSINLGDGVSTKGQKSREALEKELAAIDPPNLKHKTILDIGSYDGYYAFECERRGAERVVALDKLVWEYKAIFSDLYYDCLKLNNIAPEPPCKTELLKWEHRPDEMPGGKRFDIAHKA